MSSSSRNYSVNGSRSDMSDDETTTVNKRGTRQTYSSTKEEFKESMGKMLSSVRNIVKLQKIVAERKTVTEINFNGKTQKINQSTITNLLSQLSTNFNSRVKEYNSSAKKPVRTPSSRTGGGEGLRKPTAFSDQFKQFLEESNLGNGVCFGFVNFPGMSSEEKVDWCRMDSSISSNEKKIRDFIKSNEKDFIASANAFERENGGDMTFNKNNIYDLINIKKNLPLLFKDQIMPGQFAISILSNMNSLNLEKSTSAGGRTHPSEAMNDLDKSKHRTNWVYNGKELSIPESSMTDALREKEDSNGKSLFTRLKERVAYDEKNKKDGKKDKIKMFIPKKGAEGDNYGYTHSSLMVIYSFYTIPSAAYNNDITSKLNTPEVEAASAEHKAYVARIKAAMQKLNTKKSSKKSIRPAPSSRSAASSSDSEDEAPRSRRSAVKKAVVETDSDESEDDAPRSSRRSNRKSSAKSSRRSSRNSRRPEDDDDF